MKKLCLLLLVVPFLILAQDDSGYIDNLTHIKVKMGHEAQFAEGVKMYKKCYVENGGEDTWSFWSRLQGKGTVYAVTSMMENWAEMDKEPDAASGMCRAMFPSFISPHMEEVYTSITSFMPSISKDGSGTMDKVWVTYFQVKNKQDFMTVINAVTAEIKKAEGDERGYWYSFQGGSKDSPDYLVAWPFDKYADLDKDMDGVWTVYENAHGKKKTAEMRAMYRNAVEDSWGYIYDKSDEMSKTD
jgi:hypothetical protein